MKPRELVGKQIHKMLTERSDGELDTILFDDGESYTLLSAQDEYEFHDCDSTARCLYVIKDRERWEQYDQDPRLREATSFP
jgi:hypothetical protein